MRTIGLIAISIFLAGCGIYYASHPEAHPLNQKLDPWLGRSKEDRIKSIGVPAACTPLKAGGEVCEWRFSGTSSDANTHCRSDLMGGLNCSGGGASSFNSRVMFIYDGEGIAKEWNYWDSDGKKRGSAEKPN